MFAAQAKAVAEGKTAVVAEVVEKKVVAAGPNRQNRKQWPPRARQSFWTWAAMLKDAVRDVNGKGACGTRTLADPALQCAIHNVSQTFKNLCTSLLACFVGQKMSGYGFKKPGAA